MIFCTPANEDDYVTAVYTKNNTLQKIEDIEDYEIIGNIYESGHLLGNTDTKA